MSKRSKQRACPAAGREISALECGEHRSSRYACPADCPHSPLAPANYSELLALEDALDSKSLRWTLDHATDRATMEREVNLALEHPSKHYMHAFVSWRLYFQRDAEGLTCAERWEREGFPGLKNDERVLMRAKMRTRVALLEVHRVLDAERVEVVDLWEPEAGPLLIHDRSLASVAVRFAAFVAWCYRLPHYLRLSGTAIVLPDLGPFEPVETVGELVRHLGGPAESGALRRWLAEHFVRFNEAVWATACARRRLMFEQMDAQAGSAVYELASSFADCRQTLDSGPHIETDPLTKKEMQEGFTLARVWFDDAPDVSHALPPGGQQSLGRVLLGPTQWRLEAFGAGRLEKLRKRFEARLGDRVRFRSESRVDLARQIALKEPQADPALVPPRLLEQPQKILLTTSRVPAPPPDCSQEDYQAELAMAQEREFVERPLPALDGHTPRDAARDPALRPKLIRLLKERVRSCDERNLRTGRRDDANWLLRELGLTEILFDPPPPRPPKELEPATFEDEDDFLDDDNPEEDGEFADDVDLPDPPRLPAEPLGAEESLARLQAVIETFHTAKEGFEAMLASGTTLLDDVDELAGELLTDDELSIFATFLLQLWFALMPTGCRAPELEWDSLANRFDRDLDRLYHALDHGKPADLQRFVEQSRQPWLMQVLATDLLDAATRAPKKFRPRLEAQPVMLALLRAVLDELDLALRG